MRGLLFIIFSVIFLSVSGQINPTGFGKLQLGMDISEFTSDTIKNHKDSIRMSVCVTCNDNIRDLHLDSLVVNDVLTLQDISLSFYKGKLYKIEIGDDLSDILSLKYGSPNFYTVLSYPSLDKGDLYIYVDEHRKNIIKSQYDAYSVCIWHTSNDTDLFARYRNRKYKYLITNTMLYKKSIMEQIELENNMKKELILEKFRKEIKQENENKKKKLLEGF